MFLIIVIALNLDFIRNKVYNLLLIPNAVSVVAARLSDNWRKNK